MVRRNKQRKRELDQLTVSFVHKDLVFVSSDTAGRMSHVTVSALLFEMKPLSTLS